MKVADYILDFLSEHVKHVFGITGGFITPLFDAFHKRDDITYICTQHEQAAAMAADAYARLRGFGVAVSTSGPGATNLITGIGCSWFDSIPVLFITGQVPTGEARGSMKVRQRGFQETDIVSIVKPITKYANIVSNPRNVDYELQIALWHATHGRRGPVLLDFPMDVLMAEMPDDRLGFSPPATAKPAFNADPVIEMLAQAERPVIIYGAGCREYREDLLRFVENSGIPCLPSWAALDIIPHDHPLFVSQFGVYGSRAGNYTVQNADLIIAVGTRLDTRMTGNKGFGSKAYLVVVDIDIAEATKLKPDVCIIADAGDFLRAMPKCPREYPDWLRRINGWKEKYRITPKESWSIQPVQIMSELNDLLPDDAIIIPDCGANLTWAQQGLRLKDNQRMFSAYGYSPMGYALAASIGAHFATGKEIYCIIGDGGMQMNIQELQTLKRYNIPVKVFVLNNNGYGIIKQFQEELFDGRYIATGYASGYSVPDFQRVAEAYGIKNIRIPSAVCLRWMLDVAIKEKWAYVVDIAVDDGARIEPKTRFGNPIERQHPLLSDDEHAENMR